MIIDTDVLIWYLRGHSKAREVVEAAIPFSVSAVTYMELVQGMKDKIDREISSRAIFYVQEYHLSHSMMMGDSLIAATAVQEGEPLMTANDKHYRHVPNIDLKKFVVES